MHALPNISAAPSQAGTRLSLQPTRVTQVAALPARRAAWRAFVRAAWRLPSTGGLAPLEPVYIDLHEPDYRQT